MKKIILLSFLGLTLIFSTAVVTFNNWQLFVRQNRLPQSNAVPGVLYSKAQSQYLEEIRNLNSEYEKQIDICEDEFESEFGWYLKMETGKRRAFLEKKENLFGMLEKLKDFKGSFDTSERMLKILADPVAESFKNHEIGNSVSYATSCKEYEKGIVLGDLLNLTNNKIVVAKSILGHLKNELKFLVYPNLSYDKIGIFINLEFLLGRDKLDREELKVIMTEYHNYFQEMKELYKKSGFDFDRGGPKFNSLAQKESFQFALKFQPKIISLISNLENQLD